MPRIPTFKAREEITPRGPAVKQPVAGARRVGLGIVEAGKTLENIGAIFGRARDLEQYTNAKTNIAKRTFEVEANAINTEINNTEDLNNIIKTSKEDLQKIRDEELPKISNPETRLKIGGAFDLSELRTLNSIKSEGRRRWIDAMEVGRKRNIEIFTDMYKKTKDPIKKQTALNDIKESYANYTKMGVINKTKGFKELKETLEALPVLDAKYDMGIDPSGTRKALVNKEYGIKDSMVRDGLIKDTVALEKSNIAEAKRRLASKENDKKQEVATAINKNDMSISDIDKFQASGEIDEEFAEIARGFVKSDKKIDAVTIAIENGKLIREFKTLGLDKKGNVIVGFKKLAKYRNNVIKAATKGAITDSKMKEKLQEIEGAWSEDLGEIVGEKFRQKRTIGGFWQNSLAVLRRWDRKGLEMIQAPFKKFGLLAEEKIPPQVLEKTVVAPLSEEKQAEALTFLDDELTRVMEKGKISEKEVEDVARDIFFKYIEQQYPEILGLPEMPSGVISQKEPLEILKKGISPDLKPDVEIKRKPGLILMKNSQGDPGWVPIEQREDALKQGFTLEGK